MSLTNQKYILISRPENATLTEENFNLETEEINPEELQDNFYIVENLYVSVDPTQTMWASQDSYMPAVPLGTTMRASTLGKVIYSNNEKYQVGAYVSGLLNIQKYTVTDDAQITVVDENIINAIGGPENFVPILNWTALPTAYVGLEITAEDMDKEGKTLLVSGAAGNVGQWVVQLGKLHYGMKVVGIAGSQEKLDYLLELGCDGVVNYKSETFSQDLRDACPDGVDLYFDNVGGNVTENAVQLMNKFGRIAFCGFISAYRSTPWSFKSYGTVLVKSLRVQGFLVSDRIDKLIESYSIAVKLIADGAKYRTHPIEGIENFVEALDLLFSGDKKGKVYIKV